MILKNIYSQQNPAESKDNKYLWTTVTLMTQYYVNIESQINSAVVASEDIYSLVKANDTMCGLKATDFRSDLSLLIG